MNATMRLGFKILYSTASQARACVISQIPEILFQGKTLVKLIQLNYGVARVRMEAI